MVNYMKCTVKLVHMEKHTWENRNLCLVKQLEEFCLKELNFQN